MEGAAGAQRVEAAHRELRDKVEAEMAAEDAQYEEAREAEARDSGGGGRA